MFILIFFVSLFAFPIFYFLFYEPLRVFFRLLFFINGSELKEEQIIYLEKNFLFYHLLTPENKRRFNLRMAYFLRYKNFIGADISITDEIRLFISACAVQLTFGLRNFWLTEFDNIYVHRESYEVGMSHLAMGHISRQGAIHFSWNNLLQGFQNPSDGINVGLHEMAHALMMSSEEKGWDMSFVMDFKEWQKPAIIEWKKQNRSEHVLREYAYNNLYEFFAVCVEYFFEKPNDLMTRAPLLFDKMKKLLRLNPLDVSDPILSHQPILFPSQKIPLPQYNPVSLWQHVFSNTKRAVSFIAGTLSLVIAVLLIRESLQYAYAHPNEIVDGDFKPLLATFLFFVGLVMYALVFYREKEK